jgi:hypothetical protein
MRKFFYLGLLLIFSALSVKATTYPAATCNEGDVATAINNAIKAAHDGDTVTIPACPTGVVWTTPLSAAFTHSITIQGAGAVSATTGGAATTGSDSTVIIDNIAGTNHSVMTFTTASGKSLEFTGIAILQNSSSIVSGNGMLNIGGSSTSVRIDHNHFYIYVSGTKGIVIQGAVLGVADHNYLDALSGIITNDFAFYNGANWNGSSDGDGHASWNDTSHFGTSRFFYTEDNRFNYGWFSDCVLGGRYVHRHNTGTNVSGTANHGTTFYERGCRAAEIYDNIYNGAPQTGNATYSNNSGPVLYWGNTASSSYQNVVTTAVPRKDNSYSGCCALPPTGWGYCGTTFDGTGSPWDQNSNTTTGYACLDQPARGRGDLLSGNLPTTCNLTLNPACNVFSGQWPRQDLDPIYVFANTYSTTLVAEQSGMLAANRDYFVPSGSFNGTAGIGTGTLTPTTSGAYTNAPNCSNSTYPGPAYWYTGSTAPTPALYVCTAANTWTLYYTPYTYPHPLVTGGGTVGGNLPNPPTNLAATVQ